MSCWMTPATTLTGTARAPGCTTQPALSRYNQVPSAVGTLDEAREQELGPMGGTEVKTNFGTPGCPHAPVHSDECRFARS